MLVDRETFEDQPLAVEWIDWTRPEDGILQGKLLDAILDDGAFQSNDASLYYISA